MIHIVMRSMNRRLPPTWQTIRLVNSSAFDQNVIRFLGWCLIGPFVTAECVHSASTQGDGQSPVTPVATVLQEAGKASTVKPKATLS